MLKVETDPGSGFCGGVIRAIGRAQDFLLSPESGHKPLYSLGAIVHNEAELSRLASMGLETVDNVSQVPQGATVLIRAHGEPPSTYAMARERGLAITDCTCPVVLKLQQRIRESYARLHEGGQSGMVIIFGRVGHAEVLGLLGQVGGDALVVENSAMLEEAIAAGRLNPADRVEIFSQTTKSPVEYAQICNLLRSKGFDVVVNDTICAQVASRHSSLESFAASHDAIVFVSGRSSSNGKVLSDLCRSVNPRTYIVEGPADLEKAWFLGLGSVGVCGATSTPRWLLDSVAGAISSFGL